MPVTSIQGTSIAYDDKGAGPPIVFLHCWTGNKNFYFEQVDRFSSDYRCICLDFPGHGDSGETEDRDYSVEHLGEITVELCRRLGVKKAVFAGHSLGGMVALYLALYHPDMVEGLILLDTTSHLSAYIVQRMGALMTVVLGTVGSWLWNSGFRATKAVVAGAAATHPTASIRNRLITAKECSRVSNDPMTRTLNRARNFNVTSRLGEINVPALIVVGNADLLADIRHANRLADGIPNSVLLIVRGAGHMALFEKPEIVNRAIEDFLGRTYPPRPAKPAKKKAKADKAKASSKKAVAAKKPAPRKTVPAKKASGKAA